MRYGIAGSISFQKAVSYFVLNRILMIFMMDMILGKRHLIRIRDSCEYLILEKLYHFLSELGSLGL